MRHMEVWKWRNKEQEEFESFKSSISSTAILDLPNQLSHTYWIEMLVDAE